MPTHIIHIEWEGPYALNTISTLTDRTKDYGIYQIYGSHTVYGSHVLLYIGKADRQTFGVRITQEFWQLNKDARAVQVYVGRLAGAQAPSLEQWSRDIADAEKLLIYAHAPASNSQYINQIPEQALRDVHILNWGMHRDLLAEVSGARWTAKYYEMPSYKIYMTSVVLNDEDSAEDEMLS